MHMLEQLFETVRLSLYELLAILVPGAILTGAIAKVVCRFPNSPAEMLWFVVASYILGYGCQGIANIIFMRIPTWAERGAADRSSAQEPTGKLKAKEVARQEMEKILESRIDDDLLLDLCLKSEASQDTYDRFLALRDMARATVLALPLAEGVLVGGAHHVFLRWTGLILAMVAFLDRYFRFKEVTEDAVFNQFVIDRRIKEKLKLSN